MDDVAFVTLGKIHDAAKSPDEKVNPADAAHIERVGILNLLRRIFLTRSTQAQFSMYVLTAIAMAFIKCSIACLYKRVFVGATFAFVINIFMGVIAVWALAVTLGIIFGCGKHFDGIFPPLDHALCHAYYRMGIGAFATDIALDLVLAILPLPMVRSDCKPLLLLLPWLTVGDRYGDCKCLGRRGLVSVRSSSWDSCEWFRLNELGVYAPLANSL